MAVAAPSVGYVGLIDTSLNIPRMMVGDVNARRYDLWWTSAVGGGWIPSEVADGRGHPDPDRPASVLYRWIATA